MARTDVTLKGMGPLLRKINRVPEAIRPLMRKVTGVGKKAAKKAAKPHAGDVGVLAKGKFIRDKIARGKVPERGLVFTRSPFVEEVAVGRRRGSRPSSTSMERWATRHGIPARKGFVLAQAIGERGSEGVDMFTIGRDETERRLPELLAETAAKIEQGWNRG